ncbi:MAG: M50 family metallopeptidase [Hyphomicrobium sp.]
MEETTSRGANLFRVFGVQVAIDYSWLIIFALVLWSLSAGYFPGEYPGYGWWNYGLAGLGATLLFFASVLVHELSHALVANRLGEDVRRITLFIFGGMAHLSGEPRGPGAEVKIAAAGPLTSIGLGALFYAVSLGLARGGVEPLWTAVFRYLGFVNLALAVFNLLPGFPLDGGRLLRAYFWQRSGDLRSATRRAADWGGGIAVGLMALGALQIFGGALVGGLWLIFIGMFLRGAARASYYGVVVEHALGQTRVRDLMVREPVVVGPDTSVADAVEDSFLRHGYGGFPVGSDGRIEGLLSLPMVQRCAREERGARRVREIMRPLDDGLTISPDASVAQALQQMVAHDAGRLVVLENGQLRGLITRTGIMRFVDMKTQLESGA